MSSADEELIVGHQWEFEDTSSEQQSDSSAIKFSLNSDERQARRDFAPQKRSASDNAFNDPSKPLLQDDDTKRFYGTKYRYIIGILIVATRFFQTYLTEGLAVTTVSMVSKDVYENGITQIRVQTWGSSSNAALPGTCPLYPKSDEEKSHRKQNQSSLANHLESAAEASLAERVLNKVEAGELVDWNINQRAWILSAHDIGFTIGLSIFGWISLNYGNSKIFSVAVISATARGFLFPAVASHSPFWFVFLFEVLMGALNAGSCSVYLPLVSNWFVPDEANTIVGLYFSSFLLAPAISGLVTSQLISFGFDWSTCFYLPALMLLVLSISWLMYGYSSPEDCIGISSDELLLMEGSVSNKRAQLDRVLAKQSFPNECHCDPSNPSCPGRQMKRVAQWSIILTCPTIWALTAAQFNLDWIAYTVSLIPTFLANVQHANTSDISLVMALGALVCLFYLALYSYLTRNFSTYRPFNISLTIYRRLSGALGNLTLATSLLLLMIFDCSLSMATIARALLPVAAGFAMTGSEQMPLDISPEDSGLIVSVSQSFCGLATVLAPLLDGQILSATNGKIGPGSRQSWRLVWLLSMVVNLITCAWFSLFARAEPKTYSKLEPVGECRSKRPDIFSNTKRYNWHLDNRRYV